MTPIEIEHVQKSFALVQPIADQAGLLFYGRLFEIAPTVRAMFPEDITQQSRKLMQVLAVAANGLNNPSALIPIVKSLGTRHLRYGVKDEHYGPVGEALIWTLERGLGAAFTPDVKQSWVGAYELLSSIMRDAGREAMATAAPASH